VNRRLRRALDRVLREERCGSCGERLDSRAHEAELVAPDGRIFKHLACRRCVAEGLSGLEGQRAVAHRARLHLAPAEGQA